MSEVAQARLGTLAELVTPVDEKIAVKKDPNLPYVGLEHIGQRNSQLLGWAASETSVSVNSVFEASDVLFGKLRPNLRKCVSAPFAGYCSTDILVLRVRNGNDPSFAARVFQTEAVGAEAERTSMGTKMPRTSWKGLSQFRVPIPEPMHQSKIAEVLDTLDAAIRGTEAVVAKLRAMKQGLLHDLLTRGIDANGDLRPPQPEAPHLYHQSPLGWLPKEWDAVLLDQIVDNRRPVVYGILMPGYGFPGGVPVIKVKDIIGSQILSEQLLLTDPRIDLEYRRSRLKAGDLLFSIRGSVGRMAIVPPELEDANITQDTARLAIKGVDARFVAAFLDTEVPKRFVANHTIGVAVQGINLRDVRRIPVVKPTTGEDIVIADLIGELQEKLSMEVAELDKLRLQKSGLMDDLLTGRVPVTPLL